jgi:hypothetical protein
MAKYNQRQETRYEGNEFSNMPSIDYGRANTMLHRNNKDMVSWDKVKEICDKYGFKFTTIDRTFSDRFCEFVVYLKADISVEEYTALRKAFDNSKENRERFWAVGDRYKETFKKLHQCVHELDEETELYFPCGWGGNCGIFGSDDVKRNNYSFGDHLLSWSYIIDHWAPEIYDTRQKLQKGIYVLMEAAGIKKQPQDSPTMEEMETTILNIANKVINEKKYVVSFENGKRQVDAGSYKALVVRYKDSGEYCCMMAFSRDWLGRYVMTSARPLCGECSWEMDYKDPTEDIKSALGSCCVK